MAVKIHGADGGPRHREGGGLGVVLVREHGLEHGVAVGLARHLRRRRRVQSRPFDAVDLGDQSMPPPADSVGWAGAGDVQLEDPCGAAAAGHEIEERMISAPGHLRGSHQFFTERGTGPQTVTRRTPRGTGPQTVTRRRTPGFVCSFFSHSAPEGASPTTAVTVLCTHCPEGTNRHTIPVDLRSVELRVCGSSWLLFFF